MASRCVRIDLRPVPPTELRAWLDGHGDGRRRSPPSWPRRPGAASTAPACSPRTPASPPGARCGESVPTRLDGTGAAAAALAAELLASAEDAVEPLRARHHAEMEALGAEAEQRGERARAPAQGDRGSPPPRGASVADRRVAGRVRGARRRLPRPSGCRWRRPDPMPPAWSGRTAERVRELAGAVSRGGAIVGRARPQPQRVAAARGDARAPVGGDR